MKHCVKCGQSKELPEFVKRGTGTRNICKECYNRAKRKTQERPKTRSGYKYCAACHVEKPLESFNMRSISGKIRPFSYCKDCERKMNNSRYFHKCEECGKEYRSGGKDNRICEECKNRKIAELGAERFRQRNAISENNFWYGKKRCGSENPNYNPDKTDAEREQGRIIPGYKEWVQAVYARDNYTCRCCGDNRGGNLNAHHLDGYNWCKEKRTLVSNGITLCDECHKKFHEIYGFKDNTKTQFDEFMEQYLISEYRGKPADGERRLDTVERTG